MDFCKALHEGLVGLDEIKLNLQEIDQSNEEIALEVAEKLEKIRNFEEVCQEIQEFDYQGKYVKEMKKWGNCEIAIKRKEIEVAQVVKKIERKNIVLGEAIADRNCLAKDLELHKRELFRAKLAIERNQNILSKINSEVQRKRVEMVNKRISSNVSLYSSRLAQLETQKNYLSSRNEAFFELAQKKLKKNQELEQIIKEISSLPTPIQQLESTPIQHLQSVPIKSNKKINPKEPVQKVVNLLPHPFVESKIQTLRTQISARKMSTSELHLKLQNLKKSFQIPIRSSINFRYSLPILLTFIVVSIILKFSNS